MVTMVWVVSRFRLKVPPVVSSSCISPLTSSGQRNRASWASQPQKSATLSPQPGGKSRKFVRTCGGVGGEKTHLFSSLHLLYLTFWSKHWVLNRLTPNDPYMGRTAPLTSKRCILYIYSTNIGTEYFKHGLYSPSFLFTMQFVS